MIGATKGLPPGQKAKPALVTILVVEDEVLVRMLIADQLQLRNAYPASGDGYPSAGDHPHC